MNFNIPKNKSKLRYRPKYIDRFDDAIARSLERTTVCKITLTDPQAVKVNHK